MMSCARQSRLVTQAAQHMRVELSMEKDDRAYMVPTLPREILLALSIPYYQSSSPRCQIA